MNRRFYNYIVTSNTKLKFLAPRLKIYYCFFFNFNFNHKFNYDALLDEIYGYALNAWLYVIKFMTNKKKLRNYLSLVQPFYFSQKI